MTAQNDLPRPVSPPPESAVPLPSPPIDEERGGWIATADVEAMVQLVGEVCDPALPISVGERRAALFRRVAALAGADAWLGAIAYSAPEDPADSVPLAVCDGGWRDDAERFRAWGIAQDLALTRPFNEYSARALVEGRTTTFRRSEAIHDEAFYGSELGRVWNAFGFDHVLMSIYPMENGYHSAIGLHRRVGRPPFTERDRAVVHVIWQQVAWLHRQEIDFPVAVKAVELSVRERQTMLLLLGGDSRKQVASKLGLSEHTVADYVKGVYRKLGVSSRGELFAKFLHGNA